LAEGAAVAGEAEDDVADPPVAAGPQLLAEGGLVLVEAVTHGHAHLAAGAGHLLGDADRRLQAVGDGLLGEDVQAVFEGEVDDLLVVGGRDDDGAEVGGALVEGPANVGVAAFGRQAEVPPGVLERGRVHVDRGHHLDAALPHARREELLAPGGPEPARAHLDHPVTHVSLQPCDQSR
jgi:hypothetical protein